MRAERITDVIAGHGEGPVWWDGWGGLRLVDGYAGDILTLDSDGRVRRAHVDAFASFVRPRTNGGFVVGGEHALFVADTPDGEVRELVRILDDATIRLNDGGTDPQGRVHVGSMAYDARPGAGVFVRVAGEPPVVTRVFDDVTISNGFAFSPDGTLAYYVDSRTRRIDVCDADADGIANRRPFVSIPEGAGGPDGLTVAADGSVWVALWGGSAVVGYDADGAQIERIDVPGAPQTSACTFGGGDLSTLFITTSSENREPDGVSGSVFAIGLPVQGQPAIPYAW